MMLAGGHSQVKQANETIQQLADTVRPHVESQLAQQFSHYQALEYTEQVVAGMIYHIKLDIANNADQQQSSSSSSSRQECVHIRVFQPLPYTQQPPQLQAAQYAQQSAPLEPLNPHL